MISAASSLWPRGLDRAGVILSSACAVHCALMPLAAGLLPLLGLHDSVPEVLESVLLLASGAIAVVSLLGGCRHHRQWRPWLLVGAGLAAIAVGRLVIEADVWGAWGETTLVVAGALLIASAHVANWRLCCAPRR
jgi:hypothetical protein